MKRVLLREKTKLDVLLTASANRAQTTAHPKI